jgi:hypothetical protein
MPSNLSAPLIGELIQDSDIPEWWNSAPIAVPFFSNRPIKFIFQTEHSDAEYPADVAQAVKTFLSLGDQALLDATEQVFRNYQEFVDAVQDAEDLNVRNPLDIWSHVQPTEIYVARRDRRDKEIYIQVACECDWEQEHGLQLVFRRGEKLIRVSAQDGHLTHADAYDLDDDVDREQTVTAVGNRPKWWQFWKP